MVSVGAMECAKCGAYMSSQTPHWNPLYQSACAARSCIKIEIERCRLSYPCTQRWEALEHLPDNPRVRFCAKCQSAVHLVERKSELHELARQGKCVAIRRAESKTAIGIPPAGDLVGGNLKSRIVISS